MKSSSSPDFASILGLVIGVGGILGGLVLEGGNVSDVVQITGAIIVLCGTLGAVMVTTPTSIFFRALSRIRIVLFEPAYSVQGIIARIIEFSQRARKEGVISLERDLHSVKDPFLRKAVSLAVDGTDLEELRKMMELDLEMELHAGRAEAKVYECAGGYAPTIGIIGAVLGLIQVMKHLQEMDKVGHGIATAFVATVYGVALANLFFLPAAAKIKSRVEQSIRMKELMLEGVCSVVEGTHPKAIERKLESWAVGSGRRTAQSGEAMTSKFAGEEA